MAKVLQFRVSGVVQLGLVKVYAAKYAKLCVGGCKCVLLSMCDISDAVDSVSVFSFDYDARCRQ